jgi:hypothetical protein
MVSGEAFQRGRETKEPTPGTHVVDQIAAMPQAKRSAWLSLLRERRPPQEQVKIQLFAKQLLARLGVAPLDEGGE